MMSTSTEPQQAPRDAPKVVIAPDAPKLVITADAADVMRAQLIKRGTPDAAVRFGIRGGGCTGYSYVFEFSDKPPRRNDHVITAPNGVRVLVDPKSLKFLDGTELDFAREGLNEGFKFKNPNVKDACGCGESFNV